MIPLAVIPDLFRDPRRSCITTAYAALLPGRPAEGTAHLTAIRGIDFPTFLALIGRKLEDPVPNGAGAAQRRMAPYGLWHPEWGRCPMLWQHDSWLAA